MACLLQDFTHWAWKALDHSVLSSNLGLGVGDASINEGLLDGGGSACAGGAGDGGSGGSVDVDVGRGGGNGGSSVWSLAASERSGEGGGSGGDDVWSLANPEGLGGGGSGGGDGIPFLSTPESPSVALTSFWVFSNSGITHGEMIGSLRSKMWPIDFWACASAQIFPWFYVIYLIYKWPRPEMINQPTWSFGLHSTEHNICFREWYPHCNLS